MEFGKKLRLVLEFKDIKQKDLASVLHISPSTLSGYINNGKQPDFEVVKRIASVLGVTTDYLLDYSAAASDPPLSVMEMSLIARLRTLDKDKQEIIFRLVEMLSEKNEKN